MTARKVAAVFSQATIKVKAEVRSAIMGRGPARRPILIRQVRPFLRGGHIAKVRVVVPRRVVDYLEEVRRRVTRARAVQRSTICYGARSEGNGGVAEAVPFLAPHCRTKRLLKDKSGRRRGRGPPILGVRRGCPIATAASEVVRFQVAVWCRARRGKRRGRMLKAAMAIVSPLAAARATARPSRLRRWGRGAEGANEAFKGSGGNGASLRPRCRGQSGRAVLTTTTIYRPANSSCPSRGSRPRRAVEAGHAVGRVSRKSSK